MEHLKFDQLNEEQQEKALQYHTSKLLQAICEGLRFNDELNRDDLQAKIDKAFEIADKMQTPWFAHEYIMETCKEEIEGMAQCDAEDAEYAIIKDKLHVVSIHYNQIF
jgi:hypothetical protein